MNNKSKNESFSQYKFQGIGLTSYEKRRASNNFRKYRTHYHIENLSDLQLLEELVFRETIQERYKKKIEDLDKKNENKDKVIIPKHIIDALNDNLGQILILKEKLGLFKDRKEDEYKAFKILEKKAEIYRAEHIEEFKTTCPFCSEIFFLNRRTTNYKESKLKLYKNKVLCNAGLWKVFKEGKITKGDMAQVLNVSENYIDWLEDHIYNRPSK